MSVPLFITTLSLSPKTAIGIQAQLMLEEFPDWRHLYWDAFDLSAIHPHSRRVDSVLSSWLTHARRNLIRAPKWDEKPSRLYSAQMTLIARAKARFGWWEGNVLRQHFGAKLKRLCGASISSVYAAPMSSADSERMKSILEYIEKPFVVHLWDILDEDQIDSAAFKWLVQNAVHVFCLSEPMIDYIRPIRAEATLLPFARKASPHLASPPEDGPLRIALIGFCHRYRDGLALLEEAIANLKQRQIEVEVRYIGAKNNIDGWSFSQAKNFSATGFMPTDDARDRALAECHVGFLPGPLASPDDNMYSRYSIPSRVLDYMATGLPIVATVSPDSATAGYLRGVQMENAIAGSAIQLVEKLQMLTKRESWTAQSEASLTAFQASQQERQSLKHWLTA